ncbi:conserved hypothetical protein [Lodderomyces elongisporus NRRL YB-4239]|uniref:Replication factor A protein 3 n=1 Tax=Lodderomyces elongisporus (strain ATCC 11503 / CBS 2605 / JCM 1781 / NBRC 1676 / NRRL YB-4239) TaxID=379508 RepID=A5DSZ1_LODEL|nr:conserved hypothetical protein [Lodderomyces elongisporus NRRL YB-4239]
MEATTRRIDATLLQANQNKLVRVIGKCESFDAHLQSAILTSNGPVTLDLTAATSEDGNESLLQSNKFYEVVGKVSNSSSNTKVQVYSVIELSDNLNVNAAEKLVQYSNRVPELFYS